MLLFVIRDMPYCYSSFKSRLAVLAAGIIYVCLVNFVGVQSVFFQKSITRGDRLQRR